MKDQASGPSTPADVYGTGAPIEPSKARFVPPELTCHGPLVDLTTQFGGSLTPDDEDDPV
jgi:hypothetical protein